MPVSRNIGNLSQAVIQNMNSAEGSNSVNTAPMYAATSALMANNANFQAGQNANQSQFLTVAQNTAQYQATKIGNQGKGK
jgi:hypothetical protein